MFDWSESLKRFPSTVLAYYDENTKIHIIIKSIHLSIRPEFIILNILYIYIIYILNPHA